MNAQENVAANENDSQLETLSTTSAKIRYLTSIGKKRGEIAKMLNIRYQHVRNVQITPLKKKELL